MWAGGQDAYHTDSIGRRLAATVCTPKPPPPTSPASPTSPPSWRFAPPTRTSAAALTGCKSCRAFLVLGALVGSLRPRHHPVVSDRLVAPGESPALRFGRGALLGEAGAPSLSFRPEVGRLVASSGLPQAQLGFVSFWHGRLTRLTPLTPLTRMVKARTSSPNRRRRDAQLCTRERRRAKRGSIYLLASWRRAPCRSHVRRGASSFECGMRLSPARPFNGRRGARVRAACLQPSQQSFRRSSLIGDIARGPSLSHVSSSTKESLWNHVSRSVFPLGS